MSEVEKMYENVGVEPVLFYDCESYYQKAEKGYLFTPEKQLELIKWLARFNVRIEHTDANYLIESHYHGYSVYIACFEQALAKFINILWQDLTETERNEIRDILKE